MDNSNIGSKIKYFRKRAGLSQLELEIETDSSAGSISRIEAGKVNPTKETILKIIEKLSLNGSESASLFNVDLAIDLTKYLEITNTLIKSNTLDEILQNAVNEISFQMNMLGAFILLKKETKIFAYTFTQASYSNLSRKIIGVPFKKLNINLDDKNNLVAKSIRENIIIIDNNYVNFVVPAINYKLAKILERISEVKSLISIPLVPPSGEVIGAICFGKNYESNYINEKELLIKYSEIVANIIKKNHIYNGQQ